MFHNHQLLFLSIVSTSVVALINTTSQLDEFYNHHLLQNSEYLREIDPGTTVNLQDKSILKRSLGNKIDRILDFSNESELFSSFRDYGSSSREKRKCKF